MLVKFEFCWRCDYYELATVEHATYQLHEVDAWLLKVHFFPPTSVGGFLLIPVTPEGRYQGPVAT